MKLCIRQRAKEETEWLFYDYYGRKRMGQITKKSLVSVLVVMMLLVVLVNPVNVAASEDITIKQSQSLTEDMVITGKVTVDNWATLTIPEGITVTVCDGAVLSVKGNIDIKGKIVVEHGGKLYRKEYGIYEKIVGPKDDEETAFTPLIRSYAGSVVVTNKGIHMPSGSVAHVARSSIRLWNEIWTMEHESELAYDDNVAVNVTIKGPEFTENKYQFARIVYGFCSCNTETKASTPNTYYYLYDESTNDGKWEKFDGLAALSDSTEGASPMMLQWAATFFNNARMTEPELSAEEGTVYRNQVYDDTRDSRNTYNLFIPSTVETGEPVSLILFTHGGSWTGGAKEDFDYACARYARQGYITADIDYRLFGAETNAANSMDDILADMENCINAICEQTTAMGYIIDKMATSGYSAGGHLALLYAYSRPNAATVPVTLVFEQVGPAAFREEAFAPGLFQSRLTMDLFAKNIIPGYDNMSGEEKMTALSEISPVQYITPNSVPTVSAYAGQDIIVGYQHGVILDELLTQNQVDHVFFSMPKSNHTCEYDSAVVDAFIKTSYDYCEKYLSSSK